MRGGSNDDEAKQRSESRREKAIMIIKDEEDQSSIMLSRCLASMLILILRSSSLLCFALYPLTNLAVSPAHRAFSSLRLCWFVMFRLAGVAFQMKRFELMVDRVSP